MKSIAFKSSFNHLDEIRRYVDERCQEIHQCKEEFSSFMQLAVHEIFCNLVKHGYNNSINGDIVIQGQVFGDGIRFDILDNGVSFYKKQASLTDNFREHGFGCFLVARIADNISYISKSPYHPRNRLTIFKNHH